MKKERETQEVPQATTTTQEQKTNGEETTAQQEGNQERANATAHPPKTVEELQKELAATHDKYLRLYSEFENFKRRASKEKLSLIETAGKDVLSKLLPIVDDFERALSTLQTTNEPASSTKEGIQFIYEKLTHLLQQASVQVMPIEKGADFDTELHEAVTQMAVADKKMQGKVLEVIQKGYLLKDKVLRFAKVVTGA